MKRVLGVSAFGLKDCLARPGAGCHELDYYVADAILPTTPFGRILTGDEAEDDRTHAGLYWPPAARLQLGEPLRRVPIPYAWHALVDAGDRIVRWNVGRGVSFPLPRILASHVAGLVANTPLGQGQSLNDDVTSESGITLPVVAIPESLDEFGQEMFLRELAARGLREAMLVWRQVAAALSWLDKVEGDFPRHMGSNDHIHVVYLGLDAIEFATFRLRVIDHNNRLYVLPLRDRPRTLPPLNGMDWAGRVIEELIDGIDHGGFWQAFTSFPEVWRTLAGKAWEQGELPRAWSVGQEWALWDPPLDLYDRIYDVHAAPCRILQDIFGVSCRLEPHEETLSGTMGEVMQREVQRMAGLFPGGILRGMIVCGPLVSREVPPWLASALEMLSTRGLDIEGKLTEPEAGRLWLCADCDDPIAEGAAIYGQRTLEKIPSYLDTLPQLSILAQNHGRYTWVPLLNAQEVLGGAEFRDIIKRHFQLDQGQQKLHVYLWRGPSEKAPNPEETFDAQAIPFRGITPCHARLVREVVRQLGSLEAVQRQSIFRAATETASYGLAFADALFTMDRDSLEPPELPSTSISRTPLRRALFDFPLAPERDVALDIEVRMRPASGLAKVEIVPEDESFLQGQRVRLNYSKMRGASRLPRRQRGWPPVQELVVDPDDGILRERNALIGVFESTLPTTANYTQIIDNIRDMLLKSSAPKILAGLQLWVRAIDQNGQACTAEGNEIIRRIANKFDSDFKMLDMVGMSARQDRVFSRAAWLYSSTPHSVIAYIKSILADDFTLAKWMWATEAASRAFVNEEDFRLLFEAAARRANSNILRVQLFPMGTARAICRVLMFRKDGEKGLARDLAQLFAHRALERLHREQRVQSFSMLYFQLIRLLLYLLRHRRTDPLCFDPNSSDSISVFDEAKESMADAKRFFTRAGNYGKAQKVQELIDGFERYLHYEGTEDLPTILEGLAGSAA